MRLLLTAAAAAMFALSAAAAPLAQPQASRPVAAAPARGEHTRIILLGTSGGPTVRKTRSQPASLLVVDGRAYLVDTGEGVLRQLALAGFSPSQVDVVFLTHLHFDHTADLASFMAFDWTNRREAPVHIYGPPGTEALVKAGLAYFAIPEAIFSQELPVKQPMAKLFTAHDEDLTDPTLVYEDDKVRVLAVENTHYSTMRLPRQAYGTPRSYSYRFETADRVVVFTGDTGPSPGLERLARGADILVSEVIDVPKTVNLIRRQWNTTEAGLQPLVDHMVKEHFPPEDVGRLATRAGVKMVVLTHFAPGGDDELDPTGYVAGVRREFSGPVVAGRDLDQF